jgi:hypothetical protein
VQLRNRQVVRKRKLDANGKLVPRHARRIREWMPEVPDASYCQITRRDKVARSPLLGR